jgi:1,2-diacylglycerol 3-alpha-glucosyltransferase
MKIAIASSGLGHVFRGIETWAATTAEALHKRKIDVSLYASGPVPKAKARLTVIPCLKRNAPITKAIARLSPKCTWRWRMKSTYAIEQLTFWLHLKKHIVETGIDVLHVQDPLLATLAQAFFQKRKLSCRCILAHGTEEPPDFLQKILYLQHLAPWHLEQARSARQNLPQPPREPPPSEHWTMLPNFVDTDIFCPVDAPDEQRKLRRKLNLPQDAIIWGTVAAIKPQHKRIDWLIREFAAGAEKHTGLHLVVAGSRQPETDNLIKLANQLSPGRITFAVDYPHERIPDLLRAFDAFVLTSLFEMMPIAILEALSTGIPVFAHQHPVLSWMIGPGGRCGDFSHDDTLAALMQSEPLENMRALGRKARQHALATFSEDVVIPAYIDLYRKILRSA